MIQRIQSIYLLLAVISMGVLFIPDWSFASVEGDTSTMKSAAQSMMSDGLFNSYDHNLILILVAIAVITALAAIFLYGNRKKQMTWSRIGMAAGFLLVILTAIFFYQDYQMMDSGQYLIEIEYGVLSPFLFIVFMWLALRSISKDEKLVRSMDRLR